MDSAFSSSEQEVGYKNEILETNKTSKNFEHNNKEKKHYTFHHIKNVEIDKTSNIPGLVSSYTLYHIHSEIISYNPKDKKKRNPKEETDLNELKISKETKRNSESEKDKKFNEGKEKNELNELNDLSKADETSTTNKEEEEGKNMFEVKRRFSQFHTLYKILKNFPGLFLPSFPEKTVIDKMENYTIDHRKEVLSNFLKVIVKERHPFVNKLLFLFLTKEEEEYKFLSAKIPNGSVLFPRKSSTLLGGYLGVVPAANFSSYTSFADRVKSGIVYSVSESGEEKEEERRIYKEMGIDSLWKQIEKSPLGAFSEEEGDGRGIGSVIEETKRKVQEIEENANRFAKEKKSLEEAFAKLGDLLEDLVFNHENIVFKEVNPLFNKEHCETFPKIFSLSSLSKHFEGKGLSGKERERERESKLFKDYGEMNEEEKYTQFFQDMEKLMGYTGKLRSRFSKLAGAFIEVEREVNYYFGSVEELHRLKGQLDSILMNENKADVISKEYNGVLLRTKDVSKKRKINELISGLGEVIKASKVLRVAFCFNFEVGLKRYIRNKRKVFFEGVKGIFLEMGNMYREWLIIIEETENYMRKEFLRARAKSKNMGEGEGRENYEGRNLKDQKARVFDEHINFSVLSK